MLEKEFCATSTIGEYELSRHRQAAPNDDTSSSAEPSPETVGLPAIAGGTMGLQPGHGTQDRRGRYNRATSPIRGAAAQAEPRRHRRDVEGAPAFTFVATGPAGRISPPGMVIDPYYIGDSVTEISPTSFSFSRRRQVMSSTPASEADLTGLTRKSSSTTTFSEEDFQISYHKVPESSAASWLGDGEEDPEDDFHDGGVGRRYRRRDADRVPSVELPSVRATHKTKSEQLTSRAASTFEDMSIVRPRSEDLSVHMREPTQSGLGSLESAIVRSAMLRRIYRRPSRTGSDVNKRRGGMPSRVAFGSSPGLPLKSALKTISDERARKTPSPPPPHHGPPPTPPPPTPPPRVTTEKVQGAASQQAVTLTPQEKGSPAWTKETGSPAEKSELASSPRSMLHSKEARTNRTPLRPPSPTPPRMSSFLQARTVHNELRRASSRPETPSPPRSAATAGKASDDDDMIVAAEYALSIVGAPTPGVMQGRETMRQHDKAVQVHIRTLDKRLVACTILAGALTIALVAVVLFALLDK